MCSIYDQYNIKDMNFFHNPHRFYALGKYHYLSHLDGIASMTGTASVPGLSSVTGLLAFLQHKFSKFLIAYIFSKTSNSTMDEVTSLTCVTSINLVT